MYRMLEDVYERTLQEEEAKSGLREHTDALIAKAHQAFSQGDTATATMMWGGASFMEPGEPNFLTRNERTLPLLIDAYHLDPNAINPVPWTRMPEQLQRLGDRVLGQSHAKAAELWRAALSMGRQHDALYGNLGVALFLDGQYSAAESVWRDGLKVFPGDASLLFKLAQVLEKLKRYDEAEACYREVIDRGDADSEFYAEFRLLLERLGKTEEARKIRQAGLERWPDDERLKSEQSTR